MSTILFFFCCFFLLRFLSSVSSKSTIEPCSGSDTCNAMVGYTLYTDLKVAEVATLFQTDPIAILTANAIDISYPDVENHILPSGLFLKIPVACSCVNGIRKSVSTRYKARPADTLVSIADQVFSGLVSAEQIRDVNGIGDPTLVDAGEMLHVPLPCTCFNGSDNGLPAVYLSYVVGEADTVVGIAAKYFTTVTDIMNVNAMGTPGVTSGDILAIPLPACSSNFPRFASDHGLILPNGSYAITASHCVQCSCGPDDPNMYCTPSSLAVSCPSMQCRNSSLMLGNVTVQQTGGGCIVTRCTYGGFINGTIVATLSTSFQPRCPGQHQFPALIAPPIAVARDLMLAPSPSPAQPGGLTKPSPKSSMPGLPATMSLPSLSPAGGGPAGGGTSESCSLRLSPSMLFGFVVMFLLHKLRL